MVCVIAYFVVVEKQKMERWQRARKGLFTSRENVPPSMFARRYNESCSEGLSTCKED